MHPVMHFFVLIFMLSFLITGFEGLPPIPVMFTGSLQGRIDLQGFPVSYTGFGFAVHVISRVVQIMYCPLKQLN